MQIARANLQSGSVEPDQLLSGELEEDFYPQRHGVGDASLGVEEDDVFELNRESRGEVILSAELGTEGAGLVVVKVQVEKCHTAYETRVDEKVLLCAQQIRVDAHVQGGGGG
jgi:hypothetical protein